METTRRAEPRGTAEAPGERPAPDDFLRADFPWYGLDDAFVGPRRLLRVGTAADGSVEHGSLVHGDRPSVLPEPGCEDRSFAVVVTLLARPVRTSPDGTGLLEATSVSAAAWLAGSGLLSCTWPGRMERALRQDWLEQQTALAWDLADHLDGGGWASLTLPVDGSTREFRYRESEYGWVLAGTTEHGVHLGAYGRGMSAYGLGFSVVDDVAARYA